MSHTGDDQELAEIWGRIEAYFERHDIPGLNPGADQAAVDAAERQLGVSFPPELRESLARHDGVDEGSWPYGSLLGVEGILSEAQVWLELLDNGSFEGWSPDAAEQNGAALQPGWWVRGWIPLDADGGGNGHVVDAVPGPDGHVGQILDMDHEVGPSGPVFPSITAYLQDVADGIGNGSMVWRDGFFERLE